jgi:hypothetical protein
MGRPGQNPISDCPLLLGEWHHERNGDARNYSAGSNRLLWWKCSSGHEFQAKPNTRSTPLAKRGRITECIVCRKSRRVDWTWERIVSTATQVKNERGVLPPAPWFAENDYSGLTNALYGRLGKSWLDLRNAVDSHEMSSSNALSRIGIRWRSKAEACLSDFLYARNVEHAIGRRYPSSYSKLSCKAHGMYDLHFRKPNSNEWIDVEVWGGHPGGDGAEEYRRVRQAKIAFHKGNKNFIGIEHSDCYREPRLEQILRPFIGKLAIINYSHELDHSVPSVRWSTSEEVFAFCRQIAAKQSDGIFPSEKWLRKQGIYADRDGEAYPSLMDKVYQHFGSISNLRKLLGQQQHNRRRWSDDVVKSELDAWMKRYRRTPGAIAVAFKKGDTSISQSEVRRGNVIATMAQNYSGGVTNALRDLGYDVRPNATKSPPLVLLHKAASNIDNLAKAIGDEQLTRQIHLNVKKLYLYAAQLEQNARGSGT